MFFKLKFADHLKLWWRVIFPSPEQESWKLSLDTAVILLQVKILAKMTPVTLESPGRSGAWQAAQLWAFPRHWPSSVGVSFLTPLAKCLLCSSSQWSANCALSASAKGVPVNGSCCPSSPKILITGINSVCWELPKVMGELFGACLYCTIR